jgi:hypothetical protein
MILDDEILKDGDVVKLIAVISGGSYRCEGDSPKQSPWNDEIASSQLTLLATTGDCYEM